ncbi:hypothetical protein P20480_3981 [Pseudoalteromonas sp. BSi20480]|nr:hypothetical protein P20480_3981 [Pseudoalteromonas sp. BSi20480]
MLCVYFNTKLKLRAPLPVRLTEFFEPLTNAKTDINSFAFTK